MVETATDTRKDRRAAIKDAEDSIDEEFAGDYSEGTLELLRQLGHKGAQFGEVEPWEEKAVEPPPKEECDAAVENLEAIDSELGRLQRYKPDEMELAWIDYKRALVEDASDREVTWLKLKAYHHGLDMLRAASGGVPATTPTATSVAHRDSRDQVASPLSSDVTAARQRVLQAVRALLPSSSGDEEDSPMAVADVLPQRRASYAQASTGAAVSSTAVKLTPTIADSKTGTVYHPDYLEELALRQVLWQQRQQRASAFLLGLAVSAGLSVVRWWVRRRRGRSGSNKNTERKAT